MNELSLGRGEREETAKADCRQQYCSYKFVLKVFLVTSVFVDPHAAEFKQPPRHSQSFAQDRTNPARRSILAEDAQIFLCPRRVHTASNMLGRFSWMNLKGLTTLQNGSSKEIVNMIRSKTEATERLSGTFEIVLLGVRGACSVFRVC